MATFRGDDAALNPGSSPGQGGDQNPGARSAPSPARPASTRDRILVAAMAAFSRKGVSGTSLDGLAADLGLTKQTILYHFNSKDGLVEAVFEAGTSRLLEVLDEAIAISRPGWDRIEASVRAAFALAVREPDLLGLLREASRVGPPVSDVVIDALQPRIDQAVDHLQASVDAGSVTGGDARLVLVTAYSMVTGVVTDAEVLRAVGIGLDLRTAAGLRRTLLSFLEAALLADHLTRREWAAQSGDH